MRQVTLLIIFGSSILFNPFAGWLLLGTPFELGTSPAAAQEIGFLEEFALAENRETVLKQLVPGTGDYYFFHCLHYQHTEQLAKVDELLETWIQRFGYTAQVNQIRSRQALLKYSADPAATLTYLQQKLNLNFNHQREIPQTQRDLPSQLDPSVIDPEKQKAAALTRYQNSDGFTEEGLRLLADTDLNTIQRRHLLERLTQPDFPNVVELIVRDLKEPDGGSFGRLEIHRNLTLKQLEELATKLPNVAEQTDYVSIFINKLAPSEDVNWLADKTSHQKYLGRLWTFAKNLPPAHNSLKAHILFRKLDLDRSEGVYDLELFNAYLKLPRQVSYINPVLLSRLTDQNQLVNLNQDFSSHTRLAPVLSDEELVQSYLHHFLRDAENTQAFQPYFESNYLQRQFATVKILNGLGDVERWASLLDPAEYQQLMERVDLDFLATNPEFFAPTDAVQLELHTKNIKTLIVKIFEINTENYYRKHNSEIDTNIVLDGLVPNFEQTFQYDDAPALRIKREFKFPQLEKRGVYIVDFIAGGKSSRALIRKGRLQLISQANAAGQLFTVIDDGDTVVVDASLWIGGRRYAPDVAGKILVPFSTQPGRANAIITQGEFSCLQTFDHSAEIYVFSAAMVVDREALKRSNEAKLILRPMLRLSGGQSVPLSFLKKTKLVINSVNLDDVPSTRTISELKLSESTDTVCEFVVPPRLKSIQLTFSAEIENISLAKTETVSASESFTVNQIDSTGLIQDLHLAPTADGFVIEVRGKTGEPRAKQPVRISVKLSRFTDPVDVDLQSDENGQIKLGALSNVASLTATLVNGSPKVWSLTSVGNTYSQSISGLKGDVISVPAPSYLTALDRANVSLFEKRRGTIVADWFEAISLENGLLQLKRLKAGDYQLRIVGPNHLQQIEIRVTTGQPIANALIGKHRMLENRPRNSLQIGELKSDAEQITIQLTNADPETRVHVLADRYQPAFDAFAIFSQIRNEEPWLYQPSIRQSVYLEGRQIGDEYQYILDRKYAAKYPGNLLTRPSLLLNPWATEDTANLSQEAAAGSEFGAAGSEADPQAKRPAGPNDVTRGQVDFANLDFLGGDAVLLANQQPDKNGVITISRKELGSRQHVRVIALDAFSTVQRELKLPLEALEQRDGRLADALDPANHFSQRKQIQVLPANEPLTIADITSAKFQSYDSLDDVFRLLSTLNPNANLNRFEFILTWLEQDVEQKRKLYSEHACHELNFFLLKKDRPFFDEVVVQHLQNKRDKTFIDRWLLNENLDNFTDPWRYARLNTVERILLSQRLENQSANIIRNVSEAYLLAPTSRIQFDNLYDTAIDGLGLDDATRMSLDSKRKDRSELPPITGEMRAIAMERSDRDEEAKELADASQDGPEVLMGGMRFAKPQSAPADDLSLVVEDTRNKSDAESALKKEKRNTFRNLESLGDTENEPQSGGRINGSGGEDRFGDVEFEKLAELREKSSSLYRRLPATQQWMENNYYRLLPEQQTTELVNVNRCWRDYANHAGGPFLSPYFPEAHRTFTEMMFVLAVLDLPLKSAEPKLEYADKQLIYTAAGPTIAFHQQVETAIVEQGNTTILVSENFFQPDDRFRFEDGVQFDKFISDEFHAHTLYGGQVVITNPTSTPRAIELLIQIPQGALAANGSQETKTIQLDLAAFSTQTFEYSFYFPTAGKFSHYPAHVSAEEKVLAIAEGVSFAVSEQPAEVDQTSWVYVSQNGSAEAVIEFLNKQNVLRLDLDKIAFRMSDKEFFLRAIKTLRNRYVFNSTLWSYAVKHDDRDSIQEFLSQAEAITSECGPSFESGLLTLNPVERNWYQHREYWPLVNARAHQLGPQRKILNPSFYTQYQELLSVLAHRRTLNGDDHLLVTYYMLLQDRIETALSHFALANKDSISGKIQYDYCDAYLDLYREQPESAAAKAVVWADYPVDLWRNRFKNILAQVEELRSGKTEAVDEKDQLQKQTELANRSNSFDLKVEAGEIKINSRNLTTVKLNFYEMDIELLFSRSPFAQDELDGFSMIRPNLSKSLELQLDENRHANTTTALPEELKNKNVLVEVVAGDQTKSVPYFAHSIDVQLLENYGQLQVSDDSNQKPIAKTYVKVYARTSDGSVQFHKDGYTDLRGRFDYATQSNTSIDGVQQFSILILSEKQGAVIRQVNPPKE